MPFRRFDVRTIAIAILCFAAPLAAPAQTTPQETIKTFIAAFNASDMAKASALNSSAGVSIIDEFAPYAWSGPKAFDEWGAAFDADAKTFAITEARLTLGAPLVKNVTSGQAYLVYPAVFSYKLKGTSMREPARMAIALRKEASAWKIAAWSWTGTVPKPEK